MKRKHGHGSVEEHPKGSGRYRFRVRVDGELRTIVKDMSQPEAQEAADAYVRIRRAEEIRAGVTLTQFGAGFLDRRELGKKHRSAHKDRSRWKTRVDADPIGALAVATLKRIDFVGWRDRMIKAGYAAQTIRNTINLVKVALDEALDRELLPANPIADLKLPRGVCATKEEDLSGVLLPEEQTALLAAVPAHERALVAILPAPGAPLVRGGLAPLGRRQSRSRAGQDEHEGRADEERQAAPRPAVTGGRGGAR